MKSIIYVGGYARSGKSTALQMFADLEVPVYSTSWALDTVLDAIAPKLTAWVPTIANTESQKEYKRIRRNAKIWLAEDVLRPLLGRNVIALATANLINADDSPLVVCETIGGDEFVALESAIIGRSPYYCNIRRSTEQPDIDCRELLDGVDIQNDGSLDDFRLQIHELALPRQVGMPR